MDNIIQVNTAESQTIEVYYQDAVDLELDLQLMYIKSGETEISNYVNDVAKPEIKNYIQTQAEPIVAEVVERIAEPTVNEYLNTVTKPAIDDYIDTKKPELQEYVNQAESSATSAAGSAANALASEENAAQMATNSAQSATSSEQSAQSATQSANSASESAELAQSWAVGEIDARPEGSAKHWAELAQGFYPVGAMVPYAADTPPDGWLVCDGSVVAKEDYRDLYNKILGKYGDTTTNVYAWRCEGNTYYSTSLPSLPIQSFSVSVYSDIECTIEVGKCSGSFLQYTITFTDESEAKEAERKSSEDLGTFTLPNFINRTFWGGTSSGTYLEAGLPNITGSIANLGGQTNVAYCISTEQANYYGAFYRHNGRGETASMTANGGEHYNQMGFDASRSSAVYGKSSTVQPAALQTLIIIKY